MGPNLKDAYLDAGGTLPGVHELAPCMPAPEGGLDDDGRGQLALCPRTLQPQHGAHVMHQAMRSVQISLRGLRNQISVSSTLLVARLIENA